MFTGLVEEMGVIRSLDGDADGVRMAVDATTVTVDVAVGDSIAVSGACLSGVLRRADSP